MNTIILLIIILIVAYILFSLFAKVTKIVMFGGIIILLAILFITTFNVITDPAENITIENITIENQTEVNITLITEEATYNLTENLSESILTNSQQETG